MTVTVLGGPALSCALLTRALEASAGTIGSEEVVVLVAPGPGDWRAAHARGARIVLMSPNASDRSVVTEAILAGADAIVDPDVSVARLCTAVRIVAAGGTVLSPIEARLVADAARAVSPSSYASEPRLTRREREVLECIAQGLSVKQTARQLGIACKTVENVRSRLFRKLGARNGVQALVSATGLGVLSAAP